MKAVFKKIQELVGTLPGWCSPEKARAMAELVIEQKPAVSVEIGVFGGRSLIALALAHEHIKHGHVFGIDPWTKEAALESVQEKENLDWWSAQHYDLIYENCLKAMLEFVSVERWTIFRTTSENACPIFQYIDVLHIDGNHSEEKSVLDVFLYLPKVKSGGFVWFDDVDWTTTRRAVSMVEERCDKISDVGTCRLYRKQ